MNKPLKDESKADFFEDFRSIQREIKTVAKKTQAEINSKSYKFADIVTVWAELADKLDKYNFIVTHSVAASGVETRAIHKNGNELNSCIPMASVNPQDKGKEITYYKRYNLMAIFNINAEDEDTDAQGVEPFDGKKTYGNNPLLEDVVEPLFVREMKDEAKKVGINSMEELNEFLSSKGVRVSSYTREACSQVIKMLREQK